MGVYRMSNAQGTVTATGPQGNGPLDIFWTFFGFVGHFLNVFVICGFWGHRETGTAITKCFEHLEDERYILDAGQLFP